MTIPIQNARAMVAAIRTPIVRNLIAQSKAKQVLREVREVLPNYPNFEPELDDRVTYVAYALLAAGCSLIEQDEIAAGYVELHSAADILESAHRTESGSSQASALHCLVGAMAFYACGQYSRAFVLIGSIEQTTSSAGIVASFLRKDRPTLILKLNEVLLGSETSFNQQGEFDDWALTICLARAVAFITEYAISGHSGLLEAADAVLSDAMIISEVGSHPSFWWLARLLRLMLKDYGQAALWKVLPPFFGPNGEALLSSYIKALAFLKTPVTELWRSQTGALGLALNSTNRGGVINLRTSAGKTRIAELAILHTLSSNRDSKVLYLAPFRSLAFELERTFSKTLLPLGYSVSHLYGGVRFSGVDRQLVNEGHITIATPEKAKAMLRAAPELFDSVKLVVVDEGHLLGGSERNIRNELYLEQLRIMGQRQGMRILALSAVLPNAEDLATWIGGEANALVKSDWKPSAERFGLLRWTGSRVSIEWMGDERCFNPHFVEFKQIPKGKRKTRSFPETKTEAVAATAARLAELGPVLIFAGQARWVKSMAEAVLVALEPSAAAHPWPETEWNIFRAVCNEELGENSFELKAAHVGVICHSNRLPPQVRISVEKLMAKCPPRIIVATSTLGQGVNIGISSVIVATTSIGQKTQISKRDFWNICGRAGRAFVDGEGKVLFAVDGTGTPFKVSSAESAAKDYFDLTKLDQVQSGLLQLVSHLHRLAIRAGISFEAFLELVASDNFEPLGQLSGRFHGLLDWIDDQLLAIHVQLKGDDPSNDVEWIDDAFRESLAAIQERTVRIASSDPILLPFLKARVAAVLRKVPSPQARRAIISSGLPLSVGILAFSNLGVFREMVDRYCNAHFTKESLDHLVSDFERWTRENAKQIVEGMPAQDELDRIRPMWLSGQRMQDIVRDCGDLSIRVCSEFYGFQLPWVVHSVAQKLDKESELNRIEALAKAGLLIELGLPTEAAAKVYLCGVRSRVAALELSRFVTDEAASISSVRKTLLTNDISASVSESSMQWLEMLTKELGESTLAVPSCGKFRLDVPDGVSNLHVRRLESQRLLFVCSTDGRFKSTVQPAENLPFDKLANDPRFAFSLVGGEWVLECRDPHTQQLDT